MYQGWGTPGLLFLPACNQSRSCDGLIPFGTSLLSGLPCESSMISMLSQGLKEHLRRASSPKENKGQTLSCRELWGWIASGRQQECVVVLLGLLQFLMCNGLAKESSCVLQHCSFLLRHVTVIALEAAMLQAICASQSHWPEIWWAAWRIVGFFQCWLLMLYCPESKYLSASPQAFCVAIQSLDIMRTAFPGSCLCLGLTVPAGALSLWICQGSAP